MMKEDAKAWLAEQFPGDAETVRLVWDEYLSATAAKLAEVRAYTLEDRKRLNAIPGITGPWQVSGRSDIPFHRQVQLDKDYIRSHSLWNDVKILLKTVPAILSGRGAY